ncbi:transmembrane protein 267 [Homalodisca vitripennis]|uniref:transmembrane protein 267 n=1 Tax=Homalodisca vitripennis TaxID=197043 RepID=UPI001EEC9A29|nr:transmembrane protein 267 [Homalodisca vitripennis]
MFFLITIFLASICLVSDSVLSVTNNIVIKALVDSSTHGVAAVLSWLIVVLKCHNKSTMIINSVFELFLCGLMASAIDIDHFIMAKSFKLKNAMSLGKKRPIFHCTTLPIVILLLLLSASWMWDSPKMWRFGWITWISFFSHHIRDGFRRGIWLWPLGSSPPVPYYVYILITLALPYLVMVPLKGHNKISLQLSSTGYVTV